MRVLAFPAFKNKDLNPYQFLLYTELDVLGVKVEEFSVVKIIKNRFDIIHLHWPESNKLSKNLLIGIAYGCAFLCLLKFAKLKGSKIVWTVHNEAPHDIRHPRLTKWFYSGFVGMIDGFIFLNISSFNKLNSKLDPHSRKKKSVIPHGHYRDYYKNSFNQRQAKNILGIDYTKKMILYFGQVRPYKGVESLISVFKDSMPENTILYICGAPSQEHSAFTDDLLKNGSQNIRFDLKFIPNDLIEVYFNAADLVVLPYKQILNSGTILLALSYNKPVLIPSFDGLIELRNNFGDKWIHLFSPDMLNKNEIDNVLEKIELNRGESLDLSSINWDKIAKATLDFYKECYEKVN